MNNSGCDLGLQSDCLFCLLYEMKFQLQYLNSEERQTIQSSAYLGLVSCTACEARWRQYLGHQQKVPTLTIVTASFL